MRLLTSKSRCFSSLVRAVYPDFLILSRILSSSAWSSGDAVALVVVLLLLVVEALVLSHFLALGALFFVNLGSLKLLMAT